MKYLVTRYGSNAANQHMNPALPIAIVEAKSAEEAVQAVYDYDHAKIVEQMADFTVYNNQYLRARPLDKVWTAETVRDLRSWCRFSQAELARELGTHHPTVSRWETGRARPRGATAASLSRLAADVGYPF